MIGAAITDVPGSSAVFKGGVIAYANEIKQEVLGVPAETLADHGAVSETVVRAMAEGARRVMGATWAVSVSGVAGPDGGTPEKPVGLVWIGVAGPDGATAERHMFGGNRRDVRAQATETGLRLLLRLSTT
jgi:PncC family amidohydrolase